MNLITKLTQTHSPSSHNRFSQRNVDTNLGVSPQPRIPNCHLSPLSLHLPVSVTEILLDPIPKEMSRVSCANQAGIQTSKERLVFKSEALRRLAKNSWTFPDSASSTCMTASESLCLHLGFHTNTAFCSQGGPCET